MNNSMTITLIELEHVQSTLHMRLLGMVSRCGQEYIIEERESILLHYSTVLGRVMTFIIIFMCHSLHTMPLANCTMSR